jgi:hypothetical protein
LLSTIVQANALTVYSSYTQESKQEFPDLSKDVKIKKFIFFKISVENEGKIFINIDRRRNAFVTDLIDKK